jgi:hypothetical protein
LKGSVKLLLELLTVVIMPQVFGIAKPCLTLKIQPKVPGAKPFHESLKSRLKFPEWEFFVKK